MKNIENKAANNTCADILGMNPDAMAKELEQLVKVAAAKELQHGGNYSTFCEIMRRPADFTDVAFIAIAEAGADASAVKTVRNAMYREVFYPETASYQRGDIAGDACYSDAEDADESFFDTVSDSTTGLEKTIAEAYTDIVRAIYEHCEKPNSKARPEAMVDYLRLLLQGIQPAKAEKASGIGRKERATTDRIISEWLNR